MSKLSFLILAVFCVHVVVSAKKSKVYAKCSPESCAVVIGIRVFFCVHVVFFQVYVYINIYIEDRLCLVSLQQIRIIFFLFEQKETFRLSFSISYNTFIYFTYALIFTFLFRINPKNKSYPSLILFISDILRLRSRA